MRTDTIQAPDLTTPKKTRAKAKDRAPRYSKTSREWVTGNWAVAFYGTNWRTWLHIVEVEQIRTRQLPGERYPKFLREDVERIGREAVRVGMPQKTA